MALPIGRCLAPSSALDGERGRDSATSSVRALERCVRRLGRATPLSSRTSSALSPPLGGGPQPGPSAVVVPPDDARRSGSRRRRVRAERGQLELSVERRARADARFGVGTGVVASLTLSTRRGAARAGRREARTRVGRERARGADADAVARASADVGLVGRNSRCHALADVSVALAAAEHAAGAVDDLARPSRARRAAAGTRCGRAGEEAESGSRACRHGRLASRASSRTAPVSSPSGNAGARARRREARRACRLWSSPARRPREQRAVPSRSTPRSGRWRARRAERVGELQHRVEAHEPFIARTGSASGRRRPGEEASTTPAEGSRRSS